MMLRLAVSAAAITVVLPSCKLVAAPFRVAGAVAEGGAHLGKSAYSASKKPFEKTPEEKEAEAKEKAAEAEEKAREEKARRAGEIQRHAEATRGPDVAPRAGETLPPLPPADETLPPDAPLPYETR